MFWLRPPSLVVPVSVCGVSFFLCRRSFAFFLSSCWGWGGLLLSLFWCGCCTFDPGTPAVFRWVSCSGYPSRVLHLADSGWMAYSCGGRFCGVGGVLIIHLVFYLVPARLPFPLLPLSGFCPLTLLLLTLRGCGTLSGSSLRVYFYSGALWLGWRVNYCVTRSSPMCRALPEGSFPSCRLPWGFQVTGCLSFCFPGDVGWASALPFPFSVLLLLRLLAGVGWVMHPVSEYSSCGGVCLVWGCGHPAALPLP